MVRAARGDKTAEVQRLGRKGKGPKSIEDTVAQEEAGGPVEPEEESGFEGTEDQPPLFPELDDTPERKAIIKLAKKLYKIRDERHKALTASKEIEDKTQVELVGKLHEAKIGKFKFRTLVVEMVERSEKVKVKLEVEDDKDNGDDD